MAFCACSMRKECGEYNRDLLVKQKGIDAKRRAGKCENKQHKPQMSRKERKLERQAKIGGVRAGAVARKYVDESLLPSVARDQDKFCCSYDDTTEQTAVVAAAEDTCMNTCAFAEWVAVTDAATTGSDDWLVVN